MRDTGLPLRTAYYSALNGNITINGRVVPVYDGAPSNAVYPYILLSTQDSSEGIGCRNATATEDTILIDIVTGFQGNSGGKKQGDQIADQVLQIVHPDLELSGDFQNLGTTLESSTTLTELSGSDKIFRKLLRFRHNIYQ